MPKPFTPWVITEFAGENDTVPATEIRENQGSSVQNLYIVNGGLERRLGSALVNTSLGSAVIQGLQWCRIDPLLAGTGFDAAETVGLLDPMDSLVSANLELYLRADQVSGSDGSSVSAWPDLSANNRDGAQATGAQQPTLRLTGSDISPNGQAMVQFDGGGEEIDLGLPALPAGIANTNGYTIYCYMKLLATGDSAGQTYFASNEMRLAAETNSFDGWSADGKYGCYGRAAASVATYGRNFGNAATGYQLLTARFNPPAADADATNAMQMWKNGVALTPDSATTNMRWDTTIGAGSTLGGLGTGNMSLNGTIGAFLIYSTAHSDSVREAIEAWLTDFFEG